MNVRVIKYCFVLLNLLTPVVGFGLDESDMIKFEGEQSRYIGENLKYLEDKNHDYHIFSVWKRFNQNKFIQSNSKVFSIPASSSSYWFTFTIKANYEDEVWININNSNLDSIQYYKLTSDGQVVDSFLTGCYSDNESRLIDAYTYWIPIVEALDTNVYHYFIKVYSSVMMEVPIELGNFNDLAKTSGKYEFFSVFFIGALLMMFIYSLFVYFLTKELVYLTYILYIFFITLNITFFNNYPILERLLGKQFTYEYTIIWLSPAFLCMGYYAIKYLNLKETLTWGYKVIWIIIGVLILYSVLNVFIPIIYLVNSFQAIIGTSILIILLAGILSNQEDKTKKNLFTFGWAMLFLACILYLLITNGLIPYDPVLRHIVYLGVFVEIITFVLAQARRINSMKLKEEALSAELILKNAELIENNEALDSFNYHVSHDLKTVLSNSNAMARMAKKYADLKNNEKLNEVLDRLSTITSNGMDTVQSFLSVGTTEDILIAEEEVEIDLNSEISSVLKRNDLKLQIDVKIAHNEINSIHINRKIIESIFVNLFTNTIKYNTNFPEAIIEFYNLNNGLKIVYSDNGIGIDLEKHGDKLFQPFKRVNHKANTEGSGLGLYLLKKMITNYGGEISVTSELGNGIQFSIYLPSVKNK